MKRKSVRSVFSGVLAGTLAVTMLYGTPWQVSAADSIPLTGEQGRKENQPRFNGYRIWDIRDWTPEADEGGGISEGKSAAAESQRGIYPNPGESGPGFRRADHADAG